MKARLLLPIAVAAMLSAGSGAAERRGITEKDLFRFVWVADPQITDMPRGAGVPGTKPEDIAKLR